MADIRLFHPPTGNVTTAPEEDFAQWLAKGWQRVAEGTHGASVEPEIAGSDLEPKEKARASKTTK